VSEFDRGPVTDCAYLLGVGDLEQDTRVHGGDGLWTASLSKDWNIWGPNGGYLAAVLLRAAGSHATPARPASLAVHFLARAGFDEVTLTTRTLRRTRRAEAVAVSMVQGDRAVAEALAWFVLDDLDGLDHDVAVMPAVARPDQLKTFEQHRIDHDIPAPPFPFWDNLEQWPCRWRSDWPPPEASDPVSEAWFRFRPGATFDDPLVDAGRLVVLLDTMGWPAAVQAHAWKWGEGPPQWIAPSLDLYVQFHDFRPDEPVLFSRTESPLGTGGLIACEGRVWSPDGALLASAASQLLSTPVPPELLTPPAS
jgi:acyl-CoA thioesterase